MPIVEIYISFCLVECSRDFAAILFVVLLCKIWKIPPLGAARLTFIIIDLLQKHNKAFLRDALITGVLSSLYLIAILLQLKSYVMSM